MRVSVPVLASDCQKPKSGSFSCFELPQWSQRSVTDLTHIDPHWRLVSFFGRYSGLRSRCFLATLQAERGTRRKPHVGSLTQNPADEANWAGQLAFIGLDISEMLACQKCRLCGQKSSTAKQSQHAIFAIADDRYKQKVAKSLL